MHTKLGMIGMSGSFRVDIFHGAVTGATPPVSNRLRYIVGRYRKEIFALYKSHTMAVIEGSKPNEAKVDSRANILKRPAFVIGAVAAPVLVLWSLHTFASAFHHVAGEKGGAVARLVGPGRARSGELASSLNGPTAPAPVMSAVRVLLELVVDNDNQAYLLDGRKLVKVTGCRRAEDHPQCLYRGSCYDRDGFVERGPVVRCSGLSAAQFVGQRRFRGRFGGGWTPQIGESSAGAYSDRDRLQRPRSDGP